MCAFVCTCVRVCVRACMRMCNMKSWYFCIQLLQALIDLIVGLAALAVSSMFQNWSIVSNHTIV